MLFEKPITSGEVVSLKLINGDEIIARYDSETNDEVTITKPLAVHIGPQGPLPFSACFNIAKI